MEYSTKSDIETKEIGKSFADKIKDGGVVFLIGELGAGKTTFVKGVAEGLGLKNRILSPTFTIFRQYLLNNDQAFYHIDLYRAESAADLASLGLEEVFSNSKNIVFIEWPEKVATSRADFTIHLKRIDESHRKIDIV